MKKSKLLYNLSSGFKAPENYLENFSVDGSLVNSVKQENVLPSKKDSGFKMPENYLEDFVVNLPVLENSGLPEKVEAGFRTPENYLEDFKVEIPKEESKKPKVISIFRRKNLVRAAAIAAIFMLGLFLLPEKSITENTVMPLSQLEIEAYLDNGSIDFNTQDIQYSFDLKKEEISKELNEVTQEAIFEYLNEKSEVSMLLSN
ncbi:hypothetical protein [Haloflavibacter putidus]|uniref:Uncharacterized protein n=1 Tax=Haloflavibacter putidus TaxID=2576776 RepID=A0A507ZXG5_9FLAO|nr:hypothetical protein [Haloflavibacter putidus]TQD39465.1 hypothetical protein FKR84_06105 [Haloflavibacter putidus]